MGVRLTLEDGSPLYLYTTHLIGNTQPDRDDQMWGLDQTIRKHIARNGEDYEKAHILVGGDFNSDPTTPGVHNLLSRGYHDSFEDAHPGNTACSNCADPTMIDFNPMTIAPGLFPVQDQVTPRNRIDFVLTRGPEMQTLASTLVFTTPRRGIWMSDHSGLLSTIAVGAPSDPAPVPNPLSDRENMGVQGKVLHVTDDLLLCKDLEAGTALAAETLATETLASQSKMSACDMPSLGLVSWEHGLTFINDSHYNVTIRIRPRFGSGGRVWARSHDVLGPGPHRVFLPPGV